LIKIPVNKGLFHKNDSIEKRMAAILSYLDLHEDARRAAEDFIDGTHSDTFIFEDIPFVSKTFHDPKQEATLDLIAERLGNLAAGFIKFHHHGELKIVMEHVTPLDKYIEHKDLQGDIKGIQAILTKYFDLNINIIKRGLINPDVKLSNYGVRENGDLVLIDFGEIIEVESFFDETSPHLPFMRDNFNEILKDQNFNKRFGFGELIVKYGFHDISTISTTVRSHMNSEEAQEINWLPPFIDASRLHGPALVKVKNPNEILKHLKKHKSERIRLIDHQGGKHFQTFIYPSLEIIEKIPHRNVQVIRSIEYAEQHLGGLTAGFIYIRNNENEDGIVLMEEVTPLNAVLNQKAADNQTEEAIELIKKYFELHINMMQRGLINWDPKLENYGVTKQGDVVLLDIGGIITSKEVIEEDESNDYHVSYICSKLLGGLPPELEEPSKTIKLNYGFQSADAMLANIQKFESIHVSARAEWFPRFPISSAALSRPNLILAFFAVVFYLGWNYLQTNSISFQLASLLATTYFTSFILHEAAHWLEVKFLKQETPEWYFENGIGIKNSSGWVGIVTSSSLALLAYSLFPLSPPLIALTVINLIFAASIGDWKDLLRSLKYSPEWLDAITLTGFREMFDVYSPHFVGTHSPNKNLAHVRANQQIILANTVGSAGTIFILFTNYFNQLNLPHYTPGLSLIYSLFLAVIVAQFFINPVTHNLVNAIRLVTGGSTAKKPGGELHNVNPKHKIFIRNHLDWLEKMEDEDYAKILELRYVKEWPIIKINEHFGLSWTGQGSMSVRIRKAFEDFEALVHSGIPSARYLVKQNKARLTDLLGANDAHLLKLYYVHGLNTVEIAAKLNQRRPRISRKLETARNRLIQALGLRISDEELVSENQSLLDELEPFTAQILRLKYLDGLGFRKIEQLTGKGQSQLKDLIQTGLKNLRRLSNDAGPNPKKRVLDHQHLLPQLKKEHRNILIHHYVKGLPLINLVNGDRSKVKGLSSLRNTALSTLDELIYFEQVKKRADRIIDQIAQSDLNLSTLQTKLAIIT
jgi:DNA-directed RNA polymerase specialized sigma24 family protein